MMIYTDPIYWSINIEEPVILDLIQSPTLQRLKGIDQAWYFEPHFPDSKHTRFEHSLGVYLLLKRYGASIEEQISWLIHDVSHGTFSHCLDYVFDEGSQKEQNHQDNIFEEFIKKTNIPDILRKHWFDVDYIIDDKNFPLKETILPDLCADRIDYSFRTMIYYDKQPIENVHYFLNHLKAIDKKWIFNDFESAKRYAEVFHKNNDVFYSGIQSAIMHKSVGSCLKHAWNMWYLTMDDFYSIDQQVLDKITSHIETDAQLSIYWERMNNKIPCKNDPDNYEFHVFCKSRLVDPLFIDGNGIKRVSDVDIEWKTIIQTAPKYKEYFLKFEK